MPFYDYRCEKGHTFEVMQRMTDDSLTECQICSAPVQRVLHSPAVHFKGSGFYTTDYGKKRKNGGSGDSSDSGSSESKSDSKSSDSKSKSDSKSDSKSESKPAASSAKSE